MKNLALIFILFLSVASSSLAQKQTDRVETLFKLGIESAGRAGSTTDIDKNLGFLETAIKHFTEALKIEPRNIKILLERAETYKTLFEFEMEFMVLVVMNKRYEYLNNMGVALAEKGRLQNAVIQFEIAIRNGNTSIEAFYNRGLCHLKLNENESAVADFTEVTKLNPAFILAYQSRAKAFRAIGKIIEAEADEQKVENLKQESKSNERFSI